MVMITGLLRSSTGLPLTSPLSITLTDYGVAPPSTLYLPAKITVQPDLNGAFSVDLWANQSSANPCLYRVETPQGSSFLISVPGGQLGPLAIGDLVVTKADLRADTNILNRLANLEANGGGSGGELLTLGDGLLGGPYDGSVPITVTVASTIARVNTPTFTSPRSNSPGLGDNSTLIPNTAWASNAANITQGTIGSARLPSNLAALTAQRLATPRTILGTVFDGTADIPPLTLGSGLIAPNASSINVDFSVVAPNNDARFTNSREWLAATVTQIEAETATDTTRKAWTAQRVRQAIVAWWASVETSVARLASPVFTGTPSAPTPSQGDASTRLATTAFTSNAANITQGILGVARIPTLNQDTTGVSASAAKLTTPRNILGLPFDGTADLPVAPGNGLVVDSGVLGIDPTDSRMTDAREWIATTATQAEAEAGTATSRRAFTPLRVRQAIAAWWATLDSTIARLASPNFTGTPTAPTPTPGDNSTQLATTAWAGNASNLGLGTVPIARIPTLNQNTSGNSATATSLATPRTISVTGGATATAVSFDGTANITLAISALDATTLTGTVADARLSANIARTLSPVLTTPNIGTPSAGVLTNTTGLPLTTGVIGVLPIVNGGANSSTYLDLTTTQTANGAKTFNTTVRVGGAVGNCRLAPGTTMNSGYLEIYKGDATTRLGFIGFDNTNFTYVAEAGSAHTFTGGRLDVLDGIAPTSAVSRVSSFVQDSAAPYFALVDATAPVNYKVYDLCNKGGAFSLRRLNDAYNAVVGNIISSTAGNILTIGNPSNGAVSNFGSLTVSGVKNTYAGLHFPESADGQIMMFGANTPHSGVWSPTPAGQWHWLYNIGNFTIHSSDVATEGGFIGLYKGLNSLPGYPVSRYPTVRTDFSNLYFSAGGDYSASMSANGVWTAISDKSKKTVVEEIDLDTILDKIAKLPVNRYFFNNEDKENTHIGTFAQDFWKQFKCGGSQENIDDDSPCAPDKMLATADVAGVCLAGIKSLIVETAALRKEVKQLRINLDGH